jgi:hypothetical protein
MRKTDRAEEREEDGKITAKSLMTQTPSGVEEMCQLVRERCCSLSKLAPERKSSSPGSTAPFLTAPASPGGAKGEITSHQRDCYWTIPCSASLHWSVAMCQRVARSEYQRTTMGTGHASGFGLVQICIEMPKIGGHSRAGLWATCWRCAALHRALSRD